LDNGLIINNKDKEKKLGQTKQFMKVNIWMVSSMDRDTLNGVIIVITKVSFNVI
jgi:hypothetical protein